MATSWASRWGNYSYYWNGDVPRVLRKAQYIIGSQPAHCTGTAALNISGTPVAPTDRYAARWSAKGAVFKASSDLRFKPYFRDSAVGRLDCAAYELRTYLGFDLANDTDAWTFNQSHQVLAWALEKQNWVTDAQILRRVRRLLLECPRHGPRLGKCSKKCRLRIDKLHWDERPLSEILRMSTGQLGGEMDDCHFATCWLDRVAEATGYRDLDEIFYRGTAEQIIEFLDWAIAETEYGPWRYNSNAHEFRH